MKNHAISKEDALETFASDFATNPNVLLEYLSKYPQFSIDLVDLSRELTHMARLEEDTSRDDEALLSLSMLKFNNENLGSSKLQFASDNLFKSVAKKFKIPYLVMLAIKERRIEPSTISDQLMELIAKILDTTNQDLKLFLSHSISVSVKANKSNHKPITASKVSFEQILRDANISSEKLAELIEKGL